MKFQSIVEYLQDLVIVNADVKFTLCKWDDQTLVFVDPHLPDHIVAVFLRGRLVREYYVTRKPVTHEPHKLYTLGAIIEG